MRRYVLRHEHLKEIGFKHDGHVWVYNKTIHGWDTEVLFLAFDKEPRHYRVYIFTWDYGHFFTIKYLDELNSLWKLMFKKEIVQFLSRDYNLKQ